MSSSAERANDVIESIEKAYARSPQGNMLALIALAVNIHAHAVGAQMETVQDQANDFTINLMHASLQIIPELEARIDDGDEASEIAIDVYERFCAAEHLPSEYPSSAEMDENNNFIKIINGLCQYLLSLDIDPQTYIQAQSYGFQTELEEDA